MTVTDVGCGPLLIRYRQHLSARVEWSYTGSTARSPARFGLTDDSQIDRSPKLAVLLGSVSSLWLCRIRRVPIHTPGICRTTYWSILIASRLNAPLCLFVSEGPPVVAVPDVEHLYPSMLFTVPRVQQNQMLHLCQHMPHEAGGWILWYPDSVLCLHGSSKLAPTFDPSPILEHKGLKGVIFQSL